MLNLCYYAKRAAHGLHVTFRRYPTVAKPTNCVLSAKINFLREKRSTTQEKPAIADNRC